MQQIISSLLEPERLDTYLANQFPGYTRSFFARIIQKRGVTVNEKLVHKSGYIVKNEDILSFVMFEPKQKLEPCTLQNFAFEILDEQDDFLITNKAAGLLVHSTSPNSTEPSLVQGILAKYANLEIMQEDLRAGLVHRLDKETSGLVLVAKNSQALSMLGNLFLNRAIKKIYLAIVIGHTEATGSIDLPLGRDPHVRHKRKVYGLQAKEAHTEYRAIKYLKAHTLLEVQIKTGRTHQIRVHMAAIGHPVLGDFLYGQTSPLIARQALHAQKLEFVFKKNLFSYEAPLPKDMQKIIDTQE